MSNFVKTNRLGCHPSCSRFLVALLCVLCGSVVNSFAGEPAIRNLNLRGLQIGGTTTLVVDGDELGTAPRLLLPFPANAQLKADSTKTQAAFDVTLDGAVEPAYVHLRIVTDEGVSAPVVIGVDRLPQRPLAAAIDQLPVALHGTVSGSSAVETKFTGKAGQKLLVEVEAQRLGSKLRPVVHLISPKQLQVAWAWPTPARGGDARLEATLPEDGSYTVSIHDSEYAAAAPSFFRLRVGQWASVDHVFPLAVQKGQPRTLELLGPAAPTRLDLPAVPHVGAMPVPMPKEGVFSGPRPFVLVSPHAEVVKQETPGKVQELPAGAVGVSGRLLVPNGEDRYRVPVTPKTRVRLEVFAERYGSPLDAALVVRNEQGGQLARVEDGPTSLDPVLEYAVPDNVTAVVVGVVDSQGRGGPNAVYRLVVTPQQAGMGQADYQLVTPAQRLALPVGGRAIVPVLIERGSYEGRVELSAEGLPAGASLQGANIPEGADGALVTVQRGEAAGGAVITRWRGRAADGEVRDVVTKNHPLERLQPWLATEVAVAATTAKADDFQIDWRGLPSDAGLLPASKLNLPVKVTKPAGSGAVRLTLITSQLRPILNGQTDPAQSLRLEKPVELAPTVTDGEAVVLVPPLLPGPVYDVTLQAELLSADKRTAVAIAYAPVRRMTVRHHVVVRLNGPTRVETMLGPKGGGIVKLEGQVERREGLSSDIALTLTGLPAGVTAAPVTVKAGTTAFTLNVVLAANVAPGEFTGLKLTGTAVLDAKQPNIRVRSQDLDLILSVRAPAK